MSDACCNVPPPRGTGISYRRVLWIALMANFAMFFVEVAASAWSGSSALAADAVDFLGDAGNYALSLGALTIGGAWVSRVALLKGAAMTLYGVGVLAYAAWRASLGIPPEPITMGTVGLLALCVNLGVALLLYRFREGDANMRSVWLCTRNDVIANLAVLAAAAGVLGTASLWPDVGVAVMLALLGLTSGHAVIRQARAELRAYGQAHTRHPEEPDMTHLILESVVTCPQCGHESREPMPTDACVFFHVCRGCHERLKPKSGHCCVFCSYGSVPCPPIQASQNCCG